MSRVRVIVPTGRAHARAVARWIRGLQDEGRKIVFVSADRPYASLVPALADQGVDVDAVHFIDIISSLNGAAPMARTANATFLPSPTMLEMLAMRVEQVAQRIGPMAHMVLDSLETLSLYNGLQPVQEFSHYLANRLRARGVSGDFLMRESDAGQRLQSVVLPFCDGREEIREAS